MIDIRGKSALITGSSRGVGQQIAMGLARLGCNIIVHGRSRQACDKTLRILEQYPVKSYAVFGDLSDKYQLDDILLQIKELKLDVDILYNNAGIMLPYHQDIWSHSREEWVQTYTVNVIAMYDLCAAIIPGMLKRGFGRVVNLSSGIDKVPQLAPYGASKWAVNKLTDDISSTLNDSGVRINTLDPGWLQTDMGGKDADYPVEAVLPGALAPALIDDDGPNGQHFSAIDHEWK